MKIPAQPPDYDDLFDHAEREARLGEVIRGVSGPTVTGEYIHWDRLRRLQPPAGLTSEEWWTGLKFRRELAKKVVPLRDKGARPFHYLLPDPIPEWLHRIDTGAGGRIEMVDQITNPAVRDRYYVGSLMEEAITSSQLEGATTTRQVAKEMIRTSRAPQDRSEQMILNNFVTMRRLGALKKENLTPDLVFEIHRSVTEATLDNPDAAGRFRKDTEMVVVGDAYGEIFHDPPDAGELPNRLVEMCKFANGLDQGEFIHPVIRSIVLHFWLAYDHPFVDGNGRTARALFYWSMLRHGFWLCEFLSISTIILKAPKAYGVAFLQTETDGNDLTYFLLYHLEVLRKAVEELHAYINRKTSQLQDLEARLRGMVLLNHRQRALISHALRHPDQRYTFESHRSSHNVVYQTARTDLLDLQKRGLLVGTRHRQVWYFSPVSNLEERLGALTPGS